VVSSASMMGIWQMSIVQENNENLLASLNFLVLNEEQSSSIQYLTIMTNFWSISNMCSTTILNSSLCHDLSNQTMRAIDDCVQQPWSVFFFDIKSDW